jgi:hypothetical protein
MRPLQRRRRAGMALTAYGVTGLVLLGLTLAFVLGAFDGAAGPLGLEAQRSAMVQTLDATAVTLTDAEAAARDAGAALTSTSSAATDGSRFTADLGTTLRNLAASLRLTILGTQPFAGPADDMDRVAGQAGSVATDLEQAAASIGRGAVDMRSIAVDLAAMRARIDGMKTSLVAIDVGRWRWIAAAIVAWLAVPAAVSLWLGLRWWQPRRLAAPRARGPE